MTSRSELYDSRFLQKLIVDDEDFVWSFSRVAKYEDCKYSWFLKYIEGEPDEEMFFSCYGGLMHKLFADYFSGQADRLQMREMYLQRYASGFPPAMSDKVYMKYFFDGLNAIDKADKIWRDILDTHFVVGVEKEVSFKFANNNFIGYIDLLLEDISGNLIIVDHKSRTLKPYSGKKTPTKYDELLDGYLRQMYFYSEAVKQIYGKYPTELWFNCYRNNEKNMLIKLPFYSKILEQTKQWAEQKIEEIRNTEKWTPNCDPFFCTHLCGCKNSCEYYSMMKGR